MKYAAIVSSTLVMVLAPSLSACDDDPNGVTDTDAGADSPIEADTDADTDAGVIAGGGDAGCLTPDDGASTGPGAYRVAVEDLAAGNTGTTVYYPAEIASSPCTFSVIGWGNGTSAVGGDAYPVYFDQLARHGFVVAVAHTNVTLNGTVLIDTVAEVMAKADQVDSPLYGKLRAEYGLMGKSQGAIAASRDVNTDPNAIAAVMVAGAMGTVTRPALFATGDSDFLRGQTLNGYEAASDQAIYAEAAGGVGHLTLDAHPGVAALATSFMRCHLQRDAVACDDLACESCQVEAWGAYRVK